MRVFLLFVYLLTWTVVGTLFGGSGLAIAMSPAPPQMNPTASHARDGNIAIFEEFNAALARNTVDALELFIQRHPTHPLAREARWRKHFLQRKGTFKQPR